MNPVLLGLLGMALSFAAGTWYGTGVGEDNEFAKRAREDSIVRDAREAGQQGAAAAIAAMKPRNVTIRQEVEREIETRTVYRDCVHPDRVFDNVNEALTGRAQPARAGVVPGAVAADKP